MYHKDGGFWYGYVGDESSNTNIQNESNAISNKLKGLKKPQNAAKNRLKALDAEIAKAQEECDKLNKEKEKEENAAQKGNAMAAAETQIDELCRQIQALLDALKKWCATHPGVCHFNPELAGNPHTAAELDNYLSRIEREWGVKPLLSWFTGAKAIAAVTGKPQSTPMGDVLADMDVSMQRLQAPGVVRQDDPATATPVI